MSEMAQEHMCTPSDVNPRSLYKTWQEQGINQRTINRSNCEITSAKDRTDDVFPKTTIDVVLKDASRNLPLHCRRTLSQFYYHAKLQRPKQIVTSHFEGNWPSEDPLTLMVDQLWMLVLSDGVYLPVPIRLEVDANLAGTIITSFPSQMSGIHREFPYIYTDVVEELLQRIRNPSRSPITSPHDFPFMIIKECIGFLFNQRHRYNKRFRFLNIYEQQLSEIVSFPNC